MSIDIVICFLLFLLGYTTLFLQYNLVSMQVSIESAHKGCIRFESKWNGYKCIGMHTTYCAMSLKKFSFALMQKSVLPISVIQQQTNVFKQTDALV